MGGGSSLVGELGWMFLGYFVIRSMVVVALAGFYGKGRLGELDVTGVRERGKDNVWLEAREFFKGKIMCRF